MIVDVKRRICFCRKAAASRELRENLFDAGWPAILRALQITSNFLTLSHSVFQFSYSRPSINLIEPTNSLSIRVSRRYVFYIKDY